MKSPDMKIMIPPAQVRRPIPSEKNGYPEREAKISRVNSNGIKAVASAYA